jgi:hypothetical protein
MGDAIQDGSVLSEWVSMTRDFIALPQFFVVTVQKKNTRSTISIVHESDVMCEDGVHIKIPRSNIHANRERSGYAAGFGLPSAGRQSFQQGQWYVIDGFKVQIFKGFQGGCFTCAGHACNKHGGQSEFCIDAHVINPISPRATFKAYRIFAAADCAWLSIFIEGINWSKTVSVATTGNR